MNRILATVILASLTVICSYAQDRSNAEEAYEYVYGKSAPKGRRPASRSLTSNSDKSPSAKPSSSSGEKSGKRNSGKRSTALSFMGIPMEGTSSEFARKLVRQKGFRNVRTEGNTCVLTGVFTGETVEAYVIGSARSSLVWAVDLYLPEQCSWKSLEAEYHKYKGALSKKYKMKSSVEKFVSPYSKGNGNEMKAVEDEACDYSTVYTAEGGTVTLSISKYRQILISYDCAENHAKAKAEEKESQSLTPLELNDL